MSAAGVGVDIEGRARKLIIGHEGRRHRAELDPKSILRVGVGFNLHRPDAPRKLAAVGANFVAVARGLDVLTDEQIDRLLEEDLFAAITGARAAAPCFDTLIPEWRIVLIDLAFDCGRVRLAGFRRMLAAIAKGDHKQAIDELRATKWASENPARMDQDAALVLAAVAPSDDDYV